MNIKLSFMLLLLGVSMGINTPVSADGKSLKMMAEITLNINHYPSDSEKDKLKSLMKRDTTSASEKTIATAMINLEHSATSADKQQLQKVMNNNSVSSDVRTLAEIIHNISHKPSSSDKSKLKAIIQ